MNHNTIEVYGKWILTGEHSVLRGQPAIVFPHKDYKLSLSLVKNSHESDFEIIYDECTSDELSMLFEGLLQKSLKRVGKKRRDLKGHYRFNKNFSSQGGLGLSSALCVLSGKILAQQAILPESQLFDFCNRLEDLFHGESSGVDIASCLYNKPLFYVRGENPRILDDFLVNDNPALNISVYSVGERGVTKTCIERVLTLKRVNEGLFTKLDEQMGQSSLLALKAIENRDAEMMSEALVLGHKCFKEWGLITPAMVRLETKLKVITKAFKPSGSGMGGTYIGLNL